MPPEDIIQQEDKPAQKKLSPIDIVSQNLDANLFLFSGPIDQDRTEMFIVQVERAAASKRKNAALVLTTYGGDADAAFVIARTLKAAYEEFYLYLFGPCKSAGTLIALGADQIIMSRRGQLGPLDVQLRKDNEFTRRSSGLNISMAMNSLRNEYVKLWQSQFVSVIALTSGHITTQTASDIASTTAQGFLSPIMAQIDPLNLGEVQRAMEIAYEYGIRLGAQPETVMQLVKSYPSHSFVIDLEEAQKLFRGVLVRAPKSIEHSLEHALRATLSKRYSYESLRRPHPKGVVAYLEEEKDVDNDSRTSENIKHVPRNEGSADKSAPSAGSKAASR